jgi:hypothetical protein
MWTVRLLPVSLLAFAVVGLIAAQITYLPGTEITAPIWTTQASPVGQGNGVYISLDGALAVVVSRDASVKAINSIDGTDVWTAAVPSSTAQSFGGAFFCSSHQRLYANTATSPGWLGRTYRRVKASLTNHHFTRLQNH